MMVFDRVDRIILETLQADGRITNAQLAERAGISPPAMLERVRRLEARGVIRKYVALVDPAALGRGIIALVSVSLTVHQLQSVEKFTSAIQALEEVLECHHITGSSDFMLKVAATDIPAYEEFLLKKLTRIPGVERLQTSLVLSTIKYETAISLAAAD